MGNRLLGHRRPSWRPIFCKYRTNHRRTARHFCESLIAIGRVVSESIQDTQTHRQTDRQTHRHTDTQTFYFIYIDLRFPACVAMHELSCYVNLMLVHLQVHFHIVFTFSVLFLDRAMAKYIFLSRSIIIVIIKIYDVELTGRWKLQHFMTLGLCVI